MGHDFLDFFGDWWRSCWVDGGCGFGVAVAVAVAARGDAEREHEES